MDYFEMTVYLGIVGAATVSVLTAIWLMVRSMVPKKSRVSRQRQLARVREVKEIAEGRRPAQLEAPAENRKDKKKKKKDKEKNEKLLKLKDYPDSRLLEEGKEADEKPRKPKGKQNRDPEPAPVMANLDAAAEKAENEEGDIPMPDLNAGDLENLPSLDTLVESTDEPEAQLDTDALMSVFDVGEEVDSDMAELASSLFDVDVQNIGDLSSEISTILAEMKPK
ncbi:MAG: hypothetical protein PHO26_04600 [Dehalococcoidia bacterium]|nr:hypothetical protein [Dehalococcoidia bacterium]MDD5494889.1 hypothetical protein [Dehalococcoidia bacterium]